MTEDSLSTDGSSRRRLVASANTLQSFHEDVQYLWTTPSGIPVYDEPPSPLDFLRNHVAVSRPCIIRNAIRGRGGMPLQVTLDELVEHFPQLNLHVDITPDGHGDCLRQVSMPSEGANTEKTFVKPMSYKMTVVDFCEHLRAGRAKQVKEVSNSITGTDTLLDQIADRTFVSTDETSEDLGQQQNNAVQLDDCVLYYSRQNDCLRKELAPLWEWEPSPYHDAYVFPRSLDWAEQAFFGTTTGNSPRGPDAVNLWMGDERATSAMHKDHYENLFYVLSGEKVFSLCPPADAPFLYEQQVTSGHFRAETDEDNGEQCWKVVLDQTERSPKDPTRQISSYSKVHWIAADPFRRDIKDDFPLLHYAHPVPQVSVKAGEMLYLPSLWFHRVTQTCETIGINYWYDMNFESPLWCYFHLLQQLQPNNDDY